MKWIVSGVKIVSMIGVLCLALPPAHAQSGLTHAFNGAAHDAGAAARIAGAEAHLGSDASAASHSHFSGSSDSHVANVHSTPAVTPNKFHGFDGVEGTTHSTPKAEPKPEPHTASVQTKTVHVSSSKYEGFKSFEPPAPKAKSVSSEQLAKQAQEIEGYLGGPGKVIRNSSGDAVVMRDGKKIRFDLNNSHGDEPHFHVEKQSPNGQWKDAGPEHRYYFKSK